MVHRLQLSTLVARFFLISGLYLGSCSIASAQQDDLLISDFESGYGAWKKTGNAFGEGPAQGTLPGQMPVHGFQGKALVNSFYLGDRTSGTLTSPEFKIERDYISYLIGGGKDLQRLALQLIVDGKVVREATGENDRPGGTEDLEPGFWDVSELKGRMASIHILDNSNGSWGHINVDHLVQTDTKPQIAQTQVSRQMEAAHRYLLFPIKNGGSRRVVSLWVDQELIVRNDMELADGEPDWWAPMDVSAWQGKNVSLVVDKLPAGSRGLTAIRSSDSFDDEKNLYAERSRGQFHFSPARGWNNDPNGLVFYNGEYHLFFQHNPYGWGWGNMHWGHAVSKDLVRWTELGDKLLPDKMGPMFSGSAVVDWKNSSGLGKDGKPPLVLLYTAAGNPTVQGLAWSNDGRTFEKWNANPVLQEISGGNRDPKVIWHEPSQKWVMVLYVEMPRKVHSVHFFTSSNLKDWKLSSVTPGGTDGDRYLFECPDLFPLDVDGDPAKTKWVLTAADSQYAIGTFDGLKFTPELSRLPGHRGRGFYAAQTFSDILADDGRRIQIGWFQTETKNVPFNQSMTIPLELGLKSTDAGPRMTFSPVNELKSLRSRSKNFSASKVQVNDKNPLRDFSGETFELELECTMSETAVVELQIRGNILVLDRKQKVIEGLGVKAPVDFRDGKLKLTAFVDRTGMELFTEDGLIYVPIPVAAKENDFSVVFRLIKGQAQDLSGTIHTLKSAWNTRK